MTSEKPKADRASWAPGQIVHGDGDIEINPGAHRLEMDILNTGDRPVQVGSHVHYRRPTPRFSSIGRRPTAGGSTSPRVPRCASNPGCPNMFRWYHLAGCVRCTG